MSMDVCLHIDEVISYALFSFVGRDNEGIKDKGLFKHLNSYLLSNGSLCCVNVYFSCCMGVKIRFSKILLML